MLAGDKIDYRSTSTTRTSPLEVPPTCRSSTANRATSNPTAPSARRTFQAATAAAAAASAPAATPTIAPQQVGDFRMERLGNERWLSTTLAPEAIYPQVRTFWKDNGFNLVQDRPDAGVLETDWAENRAKLPQDFVRSAIGRVLDSAYSTGELDKFTTRIERTATGSDVFITHRGMAEVYVGQRNDSTVWQPRPGDHQLEAAFLARLMVKLGAKEEQARTTVAVATTSAQRAGAGRAWSRARRRRRSSWTTPSTAPGAGSASLSTAAASRSRIATAARASTSSATSTRRARAAKSQLPEPNVQPQEDRHLRRRQVPVKVNSEGAKTTVAVLDSQGKAETGRRRQADRQPAPRRPALVASRPVARRPFDPGRRRP
jgi:outer membrane protein assembly factor BamC